MCVYGHFLTAVGGNVLAVFPLFLRSSSFTGSLTLTPWYGLDAACSDSAMDKHRFVLETKKCISPDILGIS